MHILVGRITRVINSAKEYVVSAAAAGPQQQQQQAYKSCVRVDSCDDQFQSMASAGTLKSWTTAHADACGCCCCCRECYSISSGAQVVEKQRWTIRSASGM